MGFPQNDYPNDANFPEPSFPQEVAAPLVDPDVDMMCVRYNPAWAAVLASACNQLIQLSTWAGSDEDKKLAANRATNLKILLQQFEECDMCCCRDIVLHRVNDDGELQISTDGGVTWTQDPQDPRITGVQYPPMPMDDHHTKCDAATNASDWIGNIISETSSQLGGAGSLLEIAAAIAAVLFGVFVAPESLPILLPVLIPIISALVFLGQAGWDAYFTETVRSEILCALYCTVGDNGAWTAGQYADFLAKLASDLPASVAKDLIIDLVTRAGIIALNDNAAIGTSADADCSDCECTPGCHTDSWTIYANDGTHGTNLQVGVDATGPYIQLTSGTIAAGHYYAILTLPNNTICCRWNSFAYVGTTPAGGGGFGTPCGSASGAFQTFGTLPNDRHVWQAQVQATQPFTVKFYFGTF